MGAGRLAWLGNEMPAIPLARGNVCGEPDPRAVAPRIGLAWVLRRSSAVARSW
jgi:hypothetical protein